MAKKTNPLLRQTPKLSAYGIKVSATPEDLILIRDNASYRLTAYPFVSDFEEVRFPGHAVPWKLGRHTPSHENIEKVKKINLRVGEGLERAIDISQACKDVEGVVKVGDRWLPKKAICQIEKAGKKTVPVTA
jgi:hypothetical protein